MAASLEGDYVVVLGTSQAFCQLRYTLPASSLWLLATESPSFTPDLNPVGPGGSPIWPLWPPGHPDWHPEGSA